MGLLASIYTRHGATGLDPLSVLPASTRSVVIVNASGPFEPKEGLPGVVLVPTNGFAGGCRAVPCDDTGAMDGRWLMMGGCYVATSDSRFSEAVQRVTGSHFFGAVALHDRYEGSK